MTKKLIFVFVTLGFYLGIIAYSDFGVFSENLSKFKIEFLVLVIFLNSLVLLIKGHRQQILLESLGINIPRKINHLLYLAGLSMLITPGGTGQVIKSYFLKNKFGINISKSIPLVFIERLNDLVGIESGFMTTVHAFTGDQPALDTLHSDLRRARAASTSMIPTSTGAAKAVGLVLPELLGKLDGTAIRVPTVNVSMVDLTFYSQRPTSVEEINKAIKKASLGNLTEVLTYNNEPLVSIDFNHNPASSNFDATQTQVVKDKLVRVLSWYDNEWGFSNRMADVAVLMGK